jgi:hypothetical protein
MRGKAAPGPALSDRALGRALLARQGLLEPYDLPLAEVIERIGAVQSQYWPAPPVALFSRMREVTVRQVHEALAAREPASGILIRGTLHLVSAREHPAYAAVTELAGTNDWRLFLPTSMGSLPPLDELRRDLHRFAEGGALSGAQIAEFIDRWLADESFQTRTRTSSI